MYSTTVKSTTYWSCKKGGWGDVVAVGSAWMKSIVVEAEG